VQRIVIPTNAGVGSAIGFLLAPVAYEVVRSRRQNLSALKPELINSLMHDMREEARAVVEQGSSAQVLNESRHAYMRYVGQGHEIAVPLPVDDYNEAHASVFLQAFEDVYTQLYGRTIGGIDVEVLSWTLTISAPGENVGDETGGEPHQSVPEPSQQQSFFDPPTATRVEVSVFQRAQLQPGDFIEGPALITEDQTTTVVTSCYNAIIDTRGYIILSRRDT
jgi:N-methylhydantoinase A